jgi:hypothetical protein
VAASRCRQMRERQYILGASEALISVVGDRCKVDWLCVECQGLMRNTRLGGGERPRGRRRKGYPIHDLDR